MFRWHYGQRHYSGSYGSSTMSAHVIYESRLELARLLMADFDHSVNHIVAQPFMLCAPLCGTIRRHIPDYLLLTEDGPVVVDVKPASLLDDPAVAETFEWVRVVVESMGWSLEVASEQPRVLYRHRTSTRAVVGNEAFRETNQPGIAMRQPEIPRPSAVGDVTGGENLHFPLMMRGRKTDRRNL